jgi:hypothetical protein
MRHVMKDSRQIMPVPRREPISDQLGNLSSGKHNSVA